MYEAIEEGAEKEEQKGGGKEKEEKDEMEGGEKQEVVALPKGHLCQVVGAEREEFRLRRDLGGHEARARDLNHGAHAVIHRDARHARPGT
jgi:hypothetical protein